jgi:hypothetical protein
VLARGGDELQVGFEKVDGSFRNVTLTGPAEFVFQGEIDLTSFRVQRSEVEGSR